MPVDPESQRTKDGMDRRGLRHVVIGLALVFSGIALLFAADIVGLERRLTMATVVELEDVPTKHGGHECVLLTGYGNAKIFTPDFSAGSCVGTSVTRPSSRHGSCGLPGQSS